MRFKLRLSVLLAVVGGLLLPAAVGSLLIVDYQRQALSRQLAADHARLTEILALGIEGALWNMSTEVGRPLLTTALADPPRHPTQQHRSHQHRRHHCDQRIVKGRDRARIRP